MKIYLNDDGGEAPKRGKKASPSTTQASSRRGGFKPQRANRETYDNQGFGGAGTPRRRRVPQDEPPEEPVVDAVAPEEAGGVVLSEDGVEGLYAGDDHPSADVGANPDAPGDLEGGDIEPDQPDTTVTDSGGRGRRMPAHARPLPAEEDDDFLEDQEEALTRGHRGVSKSGKQSKGSGPRGKNSTKKPKEKKPKANPARNKQPAPRKVSTGRSHAVVDDFDASFGRDAREAESEQSARESTGSQLIGIIEIIVAAGLAFFGASQLGNILINNILMK